MTAHHSPPDVSHLDRRRFLQLGTAAATAALGGCFGFGATDYPAYTEWIPSGTDPLTIAYVDFRIAEESRKADQLLPVALPSRDDIRGSELVPDLPSLTAIDDPFLAWPLDVWQRLLAGMGFGLGRGLGYLVDSDQPEESVDELFVAGTIAVMTGEFDAERADETLRSGPEDPPGDIAHETVGERGGFTLYEPTRKGLDTITAVSETAVILGDSPDEVRTVIDTWRGDHDRAVGDSGPFGWLIDTAGDGDFVAGWTGPVDLDRHTIGEPAVRIDGAPLSEREHVVASLTFAPDDGEITADLAVEDAGLDRAVRNRIESRLGTSATEMSVDTGDDRLSATATYPDDVLDLSFAEPQETDTDRDTGTEEPIPPEGDTPPEVANAVPDGALELSYNAEQNHVSVAINRDLAVDKVTMRAVRRDYRVWINSPNETDDLRISVDPDGDVVILTATVDGVSGEVSRLEVP